MCGEVSDVTTTLKSAGLETQPSNDSHSFLEMTPVRSVRKRELLAWKALSYRVGSFVPPVQL